MIRIVLSDEAATKRLGQALARTMPLDATIALGGTLGAGKTRLVQAIAEALGVPSGAVTSPTFVLCQEYEGSREGEPVMLYHLDWYRIHDEDELIELGTEEVIDSSGVKLIEWADRFPHFLPSCRIDVTLDVTGEATREARVDISGEHPAELIAELDRLAR